MVMTENSTDLLDINNHNIEPIHVNAGSVERWFCQNCGLEATDAIGYVNNDCDSE